MISTSCLQAKIGKEPELKAALQRLRGKNADISQEAADIRVIFRFYVLMTVYFLLTSLENEKCSFRLAGFYRNLSKAFRN